MRILKNDRGVVMIAALGLVVALSALSLVVTSSGQMSALDGALAQQAAAAFHQADGGAHFGLGDQANFLPDMPTRVTDLSASPADLDAELRANYLDYRILPGNLMIRTADGRVRPAQFGQGEGLGKMYFFELESEKKAAESGRDSRARVQIQAAKPGPCADCGA